VNQDALEARRPRDEAHGGYVESLGQPQKVMLIDVEGQNSGSRHPEGID
jgi:hypothetical protein